MSAVDAVDTIVKYLRSKNDNANGLDTLLTSLGAPQNPKIIQVDPGSMLLFPFVRHHAMWSQEPVKSTYSVKSAHLCLIDFLSIDCSSNHYLYHEHPHEECVHQCRAAEVLEMSPNARNQSPPRSQLPHHEGICLLPPWNRLEWHIIYTSMFLPTFVHPPHPKGSNSTSLRCLPWRRGDVQILDGARGEKKCWEPIQGGTNVVGSIGVGF